MASPVGRALFESGTFLMNNSALEITSQYVAALAAADTDRMDALRSPDYVLDFVYGDASESSPLSLEETKQFWPSWLAGFPEMDYGTHSNPLGPPIFDQLLEPTGRTVMFRGVSVYDIDEGLIQLETTYMDLATVMVELGVEM